MRRIFIFMIFFPALLMGQARLIDSLKAVAKNMPEDTLKVNMLNEINKQLWQIGNYEEALQGATLTLELAKKLNFKRGVAASLNNIGVTYRNRGNYPKALEYYIAALKIDEELQDIKGVSKRLSNIGLVYSNMYDFPKALDYYNRALEIDKKIGNKQGMAIRLGGIGSVYSDLKNHEKAMEYYLAALKIDEELGDKKRVAKHYGSIGAIYAQQGDSSIAAGNREYALKDRYLKALEYFSRSLNMCKAEEDRDGEAIYLGNIGQLYTLLGKFSEAEMHIKKALALAVSMGSIYLVKEHEQFLSHLYEKTGKYTEALVHYKKFIAARDSVFNEENTKKQVRSEMSYEFDKKEAATKLEQEKKEAVAEAEKKKQRIILLAISGFGLLVLGFAIFAYRSFLQKKKANREISHQKRIIEEKQKEILDSIHYAKRIQQSLLPNEKFIVRKMKELRT